MGSLGIPELLIILMVVLSWVLWIWMLVDCALNEPSGNEKIVWILIILLANCVGAGIYLLVRRPKRKAETGA